MAGLISTNEIQKLNFQEEKGKRKELMQFPQEEKKNNEHACMNEPTATQNCSPLGAEADAMAKFKMKSYFPSRPRLAMTP